MHTDVLLVGPRDRGRAPIAGAAARSSPPRRRLLVAVLAASAVLGATGCGSTDERAVTAPSAPVESAVATEVSPSTSRVPVDDLPVPVTDAPATTAELPDAPELRLGEVLEAARRDYGAAGAIAAVRVDGVPIGVAVGTADADGTPADPSMRFRAGSVTKTITAALVLDQVAQGQVGLDDDVATIVGPPLRPSPPVTIRMVLDHTSGVFDAGNQGDPIADIAQLTDEELLAEVDSLVARAARGEPVVASARLTVGLAETHPRDFEPGTGWGYSNTNYQLAGLVIEAASGRPFPDVLADRLVRPLGLESTSLAPHDTSSPAFRGSTLDLGTGAEIDPTDDLLAFGNGGSGGVLTTADELLTIMTAIVHGPLLPDELRTEMLRQTALSDHTYGLGIARYELTCGRFFGHEGRVNGTITIALVHADAPTLGAVVTMNRAVGSANLPALVDDLVCGR
jgi:D-alanyl-D-alanine carboxypeptidase